MLDRSSPQKLTGKHVQASQVNADGAGPERIATLGPLLMGSEVANVSRVAICIRTPTADLKLAAQ